MLLHLSQLKSRQARIKITTLLVGALLVSLISYGISVRPQTVRADTVSITGTIFDNGGDPPDAPYILCASNPTMVVDMRVTSADHSNSADYSTAITCDGNGYVVYSIPNVSLSANAIITAVMHDDTGYQGSVVVRGPSNPASIDPVDIVAWETTIEQFGVGAITNSDLDTYDQGDNPSIDYLVTGTALTIPSPATSAFHVLTNTAYAPGGNTNFSSLGVILETGASITLNGTTNTLSSLSMSPSSTAVFNGSSNTLGSVSIGTGATLTTAGSTKNNFSGLTVTGGFVHINSVAQLTGSVSNVGGTIDYTIGTPTVTLFLAIVSGQFHTYNATVSSHATFTTTAVATIDNDLNDTGQKIDLQGNASVTVGHDLTVGLGMVNLSGTLTVGNNLTTSSVGTIKLQTSVTQSTVTVNGSTLGGGTGDLVFNNLSKSQSGTLTWSNAGGNIVTGRLTVSSGTLVLPNALTVQSIDDTGGSIDSSNNSALHLQSRTDSTLNIHSTLKNVDINDGLVGYYKLDDSASGTTTDSSSFGNTGTVGHDAGGSDPTLSTDFPSQIQFNDSHSMSFNGMTSYSYVGLGNPASLNYNFGDTISMSAWIKPSTLSGNRNIISKSYNTTQGAPYYAWDLMQINNWLTCRISSASTSTMTVISSGVGPGALLQNTWQHVACIYDGTNVKIFINGVDVGTTSGAWAGNDVAATAPTVRIGARSATPTGVGGGDEYFSGLIDDVRIYNRALSSGPLSELSTLANGGTALNFSGSTYTLGHALSISGNLTLPTGTLDVSTNNYPISVGGSINLTGGVLVPRAGTVTLTGSGTGNTITSAGQQFSGLMVNGSGGIWTLSDPLTVTGALGIQNGTLDVGSNLAISAATLNQTGGTLQSRAGTISLTSASDVPVAVLSPLNILQLQGAATYTFSGTATIATLTPSVGSTLNAGTSALTISNDFTVPNGVGFVGGSGSVSFAGNMTLGNSVSFIPGTSTITMTGASKNLTLNGTQSFYNITFSGSTTVDASSTANITHTLDLVGTVTNNAAQFVLSLSGSSISGHGHTIGNISIASNVAASVTTNLTVANTLAVNSGADLTVASGQTLTDSAVTSTTITGTIDSADGTSLMVFTPTSTGPGTAGTLSVPVRFDASNNNIASGVVDGRSYLGLVEFYANNAATRTVTLPASPAFSFIGGVTTTEIDIGGSLLVDVNTNDPTVIISGATTIGIHTTWSASATGSLNINGNYTNSGTFTSNGGTVTMAGGSLQTLSGTMTGVSAFNNFIVAGGANVLLHNDAELTQTLNVTSTGILTLDSGKTLTLNSPVTLQGEIVGDGVLVLGPLATIGTTGTISTNVTFDATTGDVTVPTRSFLGSNHTVSLYLDSGSMLYNGYSIFIGNTSGTLSISGNLYLNDTGASANYDASGSNPIVNIGGNLTNDANSAPSINLGSSKWTVGGNIDLSTLTSLVGTPAALVMTGTGTTLGMNMPVDAVTIQGSTTLVTALRVNQSVTISSGASLTVSGTKTITIAGDFLNSGTFHGGTGTVTFNTNTTGHSIICGAGSFYKMTIGNALGGWTMQSSDCTVDNNFTLTSAASFTLEAGRTLSVAGTFTNSIPGVKTNWDGTLSLLGSGVETLTPKTASETYSSLRVGSNRQVTTWNTSIASATVDTGGSLVSYNDQQVSGRLYMSGAVHVANGEYWSNTVDFDGAMLESPRDVRVVVDPDSVVNIDSGRTLTIAGQASTQNRVNIDRVGSTGTFGFVINGALAASFFEVHHLNAQGIAVTSSGNVSQLDYGILDDGMSGGSYITLANPTSTLTSTGMVFDAVSNGVDTATPYAITATGSGVNWTMNLAAGNRSGSDATQTSSSAVVTWNMPSLTVQDGISSDADVITSSDHLAISWSPSNTNYISSFTLAVGTTPGASNVYPTTNVGAILSTTLESLSLVDGQTYYATVTAYDVFGEPIILATSNGVRVDISAPDITDLSISAGLTSATVTWTTNEVATTHVAIGTTADMGTVVLDAVTLTTSHAATINTLQSGTTYYLQVQSVDSAGNSAQSMMLVFTTTRSGEENILQPSSTPTIASTPTLFPPVYRRSGNVVTIMITGITRDSSAVRLYLDGHLKTTFKLKNDGGVTSFAIPFSTTGVANGKHTYYVRAVSANGSLSKASTTIRFTVAGSVSMKRFTLNTVAVYVVQKGDSLWGIARQYLGAGSQYTKIAAVNAKTYPILFRIFSRILTGWVLKIPGS